MKVDICHTSDSVLSNFCRIDVRGKYVEMSPPSHKIGFEVELSKKYIPLQNNCMQYILLYMMSIT